jgi:hypothetical protein
MRALRAWILTAASLVPLLPAANANPIVGFQAHLHAAGEVPAVLSHGGGTFHAQLALAANLLTYRLHYFGLTGNVTEIDLHLGQAGANGGVLVVLCTRGVQPCPGPPGTISGQIQASDVTNGAAGQGVTAGDLGALQEALNAGLVYVNIHTDRFPAGEVRGQLSVFVISPD